MVETISKQVMHKFDQLTVESLNVQIQKKNHAKNFIIFDPITNVVQQIVS